MHNLNCPCCHSENTQKVSLAYANGTKNLQATTFGVAGGGLGVGSTNGTQQSLAAAQLAPPTKTSGVMLYVLLWAVILFCTAKVGLWALLVGIVIQLVCLYGVMKQNDDADAYVRDVWNHLMVCNRCGTVFNPIETKPTNDIIEYKGV